MGLGPIYVESSASREAGPETEIGTSYRKLRHKAYIDISKYRTFDTSTYRILERVFPSVP